MEVCLRAIVATLIVAGSINACDGGAAERERERLQDREEGRLREAERAAASASAEIERLRQQIEEEKRRPHPPAPGLVANDEARQQVKDLLSAMAASASAKPRAPVKCNCKPDDPLCDCL